MAEFYLDVSAVGNEYQAYADTPTTWGVPQDGNGKAGPGHAAAVAVAKIDCNGATASGTGTVGVLGVTVSSTLNASGAALATAIVSAINASATAVSATYSAALLPLNRLVFARVNPSVNTEVQIMLRIAGTDWNGIAPTRANITGGGVTAFAAGADGPFAYLCSNSTLFGKTAKNYGLLGPTKVAAVLDPGSTADVIHARTKRGGTNLEVLLTESSTRYDWYWNPSGASRQFMFDDGTRWAGDAGQLTLNLYCASAIAGGFNSFRAYGGSQGVFFCSRSGDRFRLYTDIRSGTYGYMFRLLSGSETFNFEGVVLEESPLSTATNLYINGFEASSSRFFMRGGKWIAKGARQLGSPGSNPGNRVYFENVDFEYFGLSANVSGIINLNGGGQHDQTFKFVGCRFYDRNAVYAVVSPIQGGTYNNAGHIVEFDGCTGVDAVASGWSGTQNDYGRQMLWENFGPSRDWRVEAGVWLAEWRGGQNFPTLSSLLPNGAPWSAKVMLRNVSIWGVPQKVLKLPGFYRQSTGVRTFTLEFLAAQAFSRSQLGLMLAYIDKDDVVRYQSTMLSTGQHLASPINCDASAAVWTLNGNSGLSAYKLALTTGYQIKIGTEFVAWVVFTGPLVSDQVVYFNGEVNAA